MLVSKEIHRLFLRISAIIGVVCVYAGSTLRSKVDSHWQTPLIIGVIILAIFLSSLVPEWVSWALSRCRWYRRLIMGETWIEGSWLLETRRAVKQNQNDVKNPRVGIVTYSYRGRYLSLRTDGLHFEFMDITGQSVNTADVRILKAHGKDWSESKPILAQSKLAFMDTSLAYMNVFKYDGEYSGDGAAIGWFTGSENARWPEEFTATILTKSGEIFYQRGRKLDAALVESLVKKYANDWRDELIRHRFIHGNAWRNKLPSLLDNGGAGSRTESAKVE